MEKRVIFDYFLYAMLPVFLFILIFSVPVSLANQNIINASISTQYSTGSSISGFLYGSFSKEPVNTLLVDSFNNSVPLKDLILNSPGYKYNCTFPDCASRYNGSNPQSSKSYQLSVGENETLGFLLTGNLTSIDSASFNITSNASQSQFDQIKVDVLNDGIIDAMNSKPSTTPGNKNYGCYNPSSGINIALAGGLSNQACEMVNLTESPALQIGGWFNTSGGTPGNNISMRIYNVNGTPLTSCNIAPKQIPSGGGDVFCNVNVPVQKPSTYYVCAFVPSGMTGGQYRMKGYTSGNVCGFQGTPVQKSVAAYSIGARQFQFASPGNIAVQGLATKIGNYIVKNYPEGCVNGCYVPITLISNANQKVTLNNLYVSYSAKNLPEEYTTNFYDLSEMNSYVNATNQQLSLGNFFPIPSGTLGSTNYRLDINGLNVIDKTIYVSDFAISLSPLAYAVNFPVNFFVYVPSGLNVAGFTWNFGDGSKVQTSSSNTLSHTYNSTGNYTVQLVTSSKGETISKNFIVHILPAKDFINTEFSTKESFMNSFVSQISPFDNFQKQKINSTLNLGNITGTLNQIKALNSSATSESDYESIFGKILYLKVPESLSKTSQSTPFIVQNNSIDLSMLGGITGKNYPTDGNSYAAYWDFNNIGSEVSSLNLVVKMDDGSTASFNFYTLTTTPKTTLNESYYIVFPASQSWIFQNGSGVVSSQNGYSYVKANSQKTVEFMTPQNLGGSYSFFIAPEVIEAQASIPTPTPAKNNIWIAILGIGIVLVLGVIAYFLVKTWYDKRYEKFLFPDKNQLYNAIFYITNSIKNGVEESEIKKNLSKAGWKGEQITYLMKKYHGKKTGM